MRGVRGLDGSLRLEVLTDTPEQRFIPGARLSIESSDRVLTILEVTPSSPGLFVRFGEVQSRLAGERLIGAYLTIPAAQVQIPPDRVLWDEVIGVTVYVVQTPDGGEIDLPAVAAVIVEFAPREGRIVADLTGSELTVRAAKAPRRRGPQKTPGSVASLRAAKASRRPKQRSAKPPAGDA